MTRRAKQCLNCRRAKPEFEQPSDPTKRSIPLSRGQVAIVDAEDYERVNKFSWSAWKSKRSDGRDVFYAVRIEYDGPHRTFISMHRFILGITDPSIQIDHKNPLETLNNCKSNIRVSTPSQNQANRMYYDNYSGYKGVCTVRRSGRDIRFRGEIVIDGKRKVSPLFAKPADAAAWYDEMAIKTYGEFARINFPHPTSPIQHLKAPSLP